MSQLHAFHLWLCRYARMNVRELVDDDDFAPQLARLPKELVESLDHSGEFPSYKKLNELANASASDLAQEAGMRSPVLLNKEEWDWLLRLTDSSGDIPMRRSWYAFPATHRRSTNCIREIANELSNEAADEWSSESRMFDESLRNERLQLHDGVRLVSQWAAECVRLLKAMGKREFLPRPEGEFPTPTMQGELREIEVILRELDRAQDPTAYRRIVDDALSRVEDCDVEEIVGHSKIEPYVKVVREVLKELGKDATGTRIENWIKDKNETESPPRPNNNTYRRTALKLLERLREYSGFGPDKADQAEYRNKQ